MAPNHSRLLRQVQQHLSPVPAAAETAEPTFREVFTKHEIKIPMRDGVKLHTTVCKHRLPPRRRRPRGDRRR